MAKQTFTNDVIGYAAATAVSDPKHIWIDGQTIRVFTGADMPPQPEPPTTLDARRFWTTAYDLGYLPAINAMLATLPERDQIIAQRETSFDRTSPLFSGFAQALGVSDTEVLAFFAYGANLP